MATPTPTGTFVAPVTPLVVTSDYGDRYIPNYDFHEGIDFQAQTPKPVAAMDGGTVLFAGFRDDGFGNRVIIDHGNGVVSAYAHLSGFSVRQDQAVSQGQRIATSGNTGFSQAPHLHVEVNAGGDVAAYRRGQVRYAGARHFDAEPYVGTGRSYSREANLQLGDTLPVVSEIQRNLKALGYDLGTSGANRDGVDGDFGGATQRAVQAFQRDRGLPANQQQGIYGPITEAQMQEAVRTGWRRPGAQETAPTTDTPAPPISTPTPTTSQTTPTTPGTPGTTTPGQGSFVDTPGPFAAVSTGALLGTREGTPLGALTADQSYALGRSVFGDGPGAAAFQLVDQKLGTGSGVFVQRMIALGQHEGGLNFGRTNADPASGSNVGTFQVGGAGSTAAQTAARYEMLLDRGIREYEALGGPPVDRATLTAADRDAFAHIGHMTDRAANVYGRRADDLLRRMGDPAVQGEALIRLVHKEVQGGIRDIGVDVAQMTDATTGTRVDLAAVAARGNEPDALRREPSMPILDRRLSQSYSPAVEAWQRVLAERGLDIGASAPNGIYNRETFESTKALQREAGLTADGTVGPNTWARFSSVGARTVEGQTAPEATTPVPTTPGSTPTPTDAAPESGHAGITQTLRHGDRGPEVSILQGHLRALGYDIGKFGPERDGVDGIFGDRTLAAVRQYQLDNGLPVTGVVDRATRGQLPVYVTSPEDTAPTTPAPTTPGQTPPGQTTPGGDGATSPTPRLDDASAVFLREADGLVSNVLDRHTDDVPAALAALVKATEGPGSGPLGATTPEDVQKAFDAFAAGQSPARPLTRAEAAAIAPVLDARSRLIAEGAVPAPGGTTPSGDGSSQTPEPTVAPTTSTTPSETAPSSTATPSTTAPSETAPSRLPTQTGPQL